jgi:potassium channel subfamily K member 18
LIYNAFEMDRPVYEDKNAENFQYDPYLAGGIMNGDAILRQDAASTSAITQQNARQKITCCFCFKTTKLRRRQYVVSFFTNLGIFSLLLGYTFLGSFIFLALEGGGNQLIKPRMLPDKHHSANKHTINSNNTNEEDDKTRDHKPFNIFDGSEKYQNYSFLSDSNAEARAKTVENIWEITVSLNILYRENWTRLAGQEISRFQDELVHRVAQEMAAQYGAVYQEMALGGVVHSVSDFSLAPDDSEWTLAKAFFYSLTVLTTIGTYFLLLFY